MMRMDVDVEDEDHAMDDDDDDGGDDDDAHDCPTGALFTQTLCFRAPGVYRILLLLMVVMMIMIDVLVSQQ